MTEGLGEGLKKRGRLDLSRPLFKQQIDESLRNAKDFVPVIFREGVIIPGVEAEDLADPARGVQIAVDADG